MLHIAPGPPPSKTIAEEVREYSEAAKKILEERLEQSQEGITTTKENDGEKTPGENDSDQEVKIVKHKITMGNTYKILALRYHTRAKAIKKWNKISRPLRYMIGRELAIPVGKSYVEKPLEDVNTEDVFPKLIKAFLREAKGCEAARARYYLLDSDTNLKNALARWQKDDEWERSTDGNQWERVLQLPKSRGEEVKTPGEQISTDERMAPSKITEPYKPPLCIDNNITPGMTIEMQQVQFSMRV